MTKSKRFAVSAAILTMLFANAPAAFAAGSFHVPGAPEQVRADCDTSDLSLYGLAGMFCVDSDDETGGISERTSGPVVQQAPRSLSEATDSPVYVQPEK